MATDLKTGTADTPADQNNVTHYQVIIPHSKYHRIY